MLDKHGTQVVLKVLQQNPEAHTYLDEDVIDWLVSERLFDMWESVLTHDGEKLLQQLTVENVKVDKAAS